MSPMQPTQASSLLQRTRRKFRLSQRPNCEHRQRSTQTFPSWSLTVIRVGFPALRNRNASTSATCKAISFVLYGPTCPSSRWAAHSPAAVANTLHEIHDIRSPQAAIKCFGNFHQSPTRETLRVGDFHRCRSSVSHRGWAARLTWICPVPFV